MERFEWEPQEGLELYRAGMKRLLRKRDCRDKAHFAAKMANKPFREAEDDNKRRMKEARK